MHIILGSKFHYLDKPKTTSMKTILVKHKRKLVPIIITQAENFFKYT
jgi:hypothetical protein